MNDLPLIDMIAATVIFGALVRGMDRDRRIDRSPEQEQIKRIKNRGLVPVGHVRVEPPKDLLVAGETVGSQIDLCLET